MNVAKYIVLMLFVGKFQTDLVKDWVKELYSIRCRACGQHVGVSETEVTS